MKKITIRIDDKLYEAIHSASKLDTRSLNRMIELLLWEGLKMKAYDPATLVTFRFNSPASLVEFDRWTPSFLILRYPPESLEAGKEWKIGRRTAEKWIAQGVLSGVPNG